MRPSVIAAVRDGAWYWGLGDPSLGAVVVTVLYLVASAMCFATARRFRRTPERCASPAARVEMRIWYGLALLLFALGVNKQADFQTLLTLYGRDILRSLDLYEQRRQIQQLFIAGVALVAVVCAASTAWFVRSASWPCRIAVSGLILQLSFVVIRAASFHHVDILLGIQISSIKLNLLFESLGLLIILTSALIARQHRPSPPPRPFSEEEYLRGFLEE